MNPRCDHLNCNADATGSVLLGPITHAFFCDDHPPEITGTSAGDRAQRLEEFLTRLQRNANSAGSISAAELAELLAGFGLL